MYGLKNKVQLIGHIGNEPEIITTEAGKRRAHFSIATTEVYRNNKGEKIVEVHWHRLVAWGKVAEIIEKFVKKDSEVIVEGKLINRRSLDKEGCEKFISEVLVSEILVLTNKTAVH